MNRSPELIDISRPLSADTACWPGDTPYSFQLTARIRDGSSVNVGALEISLHTATHCDAPFHYDDGGATIEQLSPERFIGPAWVVEVHGRWRDALDGLDFRDTPRVLFRTGGWPDTRHFPERIPVMEPNLPDWLDDRGVSLIGVDLPSVDALDSKTLDLHHRLGQNGILILEGLQLEGVPVGRYELIAAPLPIVGGDGSPLRAMLRQIPY